VVEMFGHLYVGFSRSTPYAADSIIIIIIIIIIISDNLDYACYGWCFV